MMSHLTGNGTAIAIRVHDKTPAAVGQQRLLPVGQAMCVTHAVMSYIITAH